MPSLPSAMVTVCLVRHAPRPIPVAALRRLPADAVFQSVVTMNLAADIQRAFDAVSAHATHLSTADTAAGVLEAVIDLPATDLPRLDATLWRALGRSGTTEPL